MTATTEDSSTRGTARRALAADGVLDDIDAEGLAALAARLGCAADPLEVASTAWAKVSGRDPGVCGLYALVELVEMAASGDLAATSPRQHLVARCFDLFGCANPPAIPRVTSPEVYARRAISELGGRRPQAGTPPLALAQAAAERAAPFVAQLLT